MECFFIGNNTKAGVAENEIAGPQNDAHVDNCGMEMPGENSGCHVQVIEIIIANSVRQEVDRVFAAVENRVPETILTEMDNVVKLRLEMALRSVTALS